MNRKQRIELIHLLGEELYESAGKYEKATAKDGYASAGFNVEKFNSKAAIQRRITTLRAELLELSK